MSGAGSTASSRCSGAKPSESCAPADSSEPARPSFREPRPSPARKPHIDVALANLVVAAALGGLIWTIQIVHYPLFALVGQESWQRYESEHQRRITRVVLPLMVANVALAVTLVVQRDELLAWANAAVAVGLFAATGAVYAPLHGEIARTFAPDRIRALVRLNWVRTAGWTVQVVVATGLAAS